MGRFLFVTIEGDVSYYDSYSQDDLDSEEFVTIIDTQNEMHYMNGGWFGVEEKE